MYRSIMPFIVMPVVAIDLVMAYPDLALWSPAVVFGR
jgi:TRAP-type mannitol/chloroaromatic compound transport system permease large subunit